MEEEKDAFWDESTPIFRLVVSQYGFSIIDFCPSSLDILLDPWSQMDMKL